VFAYLRHGGEAEPVLVLLNFGDEAATAAVELPAGFERLRGSATLTDMLNDRAVETGGGGIEIAGHGAMVLAAEGRG
jgi:hypothetical protein